MNFYINSVPEKNLIKLTMLFLCIVICYLFILKAFNAIYQRSHNKYITFIAYVRQKRHTLSQDEFNLLRFS